MKKFYPLLVSAILILAFSMSVRAADSKEKSGIVKSVDPVYNQITIGENEYFVESPDLLKNISPNDVVKFTLTSGQGEGRITSITKTGEAEEVAENPVGDAVQGVVSGAGEVAKAVTTPIPPAHEVVSGTVGATTNVTGQATKNASNVEDGDVKIVKNKF